MKETAENTHIPVVTEQRHEVLHKWIIKEIKEKIKNFQEFNENENITCQNLWDTTKAILRGSL
jgi:REP element-mobilizing transposase RayT